MCSLALITGTARRASLRQSPFSDITASGVQHKPKPRLAAACPAYARMSGSSSQLTPFFFCEKPPALTRGATRCRRTHGLSIFVLGGAACPSRRRKRAIKARQISSTLPTTRNAAAVSYLECDRCAAVCYSQYSHRWTAGRNGHQRSVENVCARCCAAMTCGKEVRSWLRELPHVPMPNGERRVPVPHCLACQDRKPENPDKRKT